MVFYSVTPWAVQQSTHTMPTKVLPNPFRFISHHIPRRSEWQRRWITNNDRVLGLCQIGINSFDMSMVNFDGCEKWHWMSSINCWKNGFCAKETLQSYQGIYQKYLTLIIRTDAHKKSSTFLKTIFTKIPNAQQHHMQISTTEFRPLEQ